MVIDTSIGQQSFSPTSWLESRVEGKRRWCMVADAPEMQDKFEACAHSGIGAGTLVNGCEAICIRVDTI